MRTNIDIDEALMAKVSQITGLPSKRAAVLEAMNLLVRVHKQSALLNLVTKVHWEVDLDVWREGGDFSIDNQAA